MPCWRRRMPAIGIALGVEQRETASVIAQDRGRRAPGGPAGRVDPGQGAAPNFRRILCGHLLVVNIVQIIS